MQSLGPGMGPVAVHRWFARGEDWAMHPFLSAHAVEVLQALDERIKGRTRGAFQVEAAGGVLVGELLDDPDCLDPRASSRHPCVVRLAFAPGPLAPPEQDRVLAYLRALPLPSAPGVDNSLVVNVPHVRPLPRKADVAPQPGPARLNWWPVVGAVAAVASLAVGAWVVVANWPRPEEENHKPPAPEGKDKGWYVGAGPNGGLVERYARVEHPYVAFLRQRPEAVRRARHRGEETYEAWRQKQEGAFRGASHPLPRRLRELVNAWREPDEALAEAAQRMRRLRKKWGGAEDRPNLADEIDAFFEALVRPQGLAPRQEFDHPGNAFLWRLPSAPVAAGRTFDKEEQLRPALRELLGRLTGAPVAEGPDSLNLLSRIEDEMDYEAWRRERRGEVFADEKQKPGPVIEQALGRFRR